MTINGDGMKMVKDCDCEERVCLSPTERQNFQKIRIDVKTAPSPTFSAPDVVVLLREW